MIHIGCLCFTPVLIVLLIACIMNFHEHVMAVIGTIILSVLTLMMIVGAFGSKYETTVLSTHKVQIIENVAVANVNGEIINLNSRFNKNFKEGDEVCSVFWANKMYYCNGVTVKRNVEVEEVCP